MNRLQTEQQRLYLLPDGAPDTAAGLCDGTGQVRALVLQLAAPADWPALSTVWQAVQAELDLPAPGIAVSGQDGLQLWFSLAQPVPAGLGQAWLQALARRHLSGVRPHRIGVFPCPGAAGQVAWQHAVPVPAQQPGTGVWSAFVSADLAPMFADEPWLDTPPGQDAQAGLLARLRSITPAEWQRACRQLGLDEAAAPPEPTAPAVPTAPPASASEADDTAARLGASARAFLAGVMNDAAAPLALRIDAARALLLPPVPAPAPGRPGDAPDGG